MEKSHVMDFLLREKTEYKRLLLTVKYRLDHWELVTLPTQ